MSEIVAPQASNATNVRVRPVTGENWADFARLFQSRGSPHYCWCTLHRFHGSRNMSDAKKRQGMKDLVENATPIGVLAYDGSIPVGWCSIAPRETYVQLARSRTMQRATPPATPTWVVLCFFVTRPYRGRNVTAALLRGLLHMRARKEPRSSRDTRSTPRASVLHTGDIRRRSGLRASSRTTSGGRSAWRGVRLAVR